MSKDSPAKYSKKDFKKKPGIFMKKNKNKKDNMVANDKKISQKMKNKSYNHSQVGNQLELVRQLVYTNLLLIITLRFFCDLS